MEMEMEIELVQLCLDSGAVLPFFSFLISILPDGRLGPG